MALIKCVHFCVNLTWSALFELFQCYLEGSDYLVIIACTEEDAAGGGVPLNQTHPPAVTVQFQHGLRHVAPQTTLWDLPYSNLAHPQRNTEITQTHPQTSSFPS